MKRIFLIFLLLSFKAHSTVFNHDIVIFGAGTSGVAVAIQAAKINPNLSIALVEETDWIGGQMTAAAVSTMDGGDRYIDDADQYITDLKVRNLVAQMSGSIYGEFIRRVKEHYGALLVMDKFMNQFVVNKSIRTCYWGNRLPCFEPKVGQDILKSMIAEYPQIEIKLRRSIKKTYKEDANNLNKITSVEVRNTELNIDENFTNLISVSSSGEEIRKNTIFIDATEYGDLIRLSTNDYHIGSSSVNPDNPCVQNATYVAVIKKFPNGVPDNLKITTPPPGYNTNIANLFKSIVSATDGYEGETNNEGLLKLPVTWQYHNNYRGLPDSLRICDYSDERCDYNVEEDPRNYNDITKTGINWANDIRYTVNAFANKYSRKNNNCRAKLRTLQFLYYMQSDPNGLKQSDWSISDKEGFNTPYNIEENQCSNIPEEFKVIESHFPVMPYVRESVRLNGLYTLTGKDIWRGDQTVRKRKDFSNAVALGDYQVDLHGCKSPKVLDENGMVVEPGDFDFGDSVQDIPPGFKSGLFQIPFGSFIPITVDGLLGAEKNISQSRLANGATRLQPSTMNIGQAAGTIAAIAFQDDVEVRDVEPIEVQQILLNGPNPLFDGPKYYNQRSPLSAYETRDVGFDHWAWGSIQRLSINNIMVGDGQNFGINDKITREQASVAIIKGADFETVSPIIPSFVDVPSTSGFYKFIETMWDKGITGGCNTDGDKFCPNLNIPREQLAVLIFKAFKTKLEDLGESHKLITHTDTWYFDDVVNNTTLNPYGPFINLLKANGIVDGCSTSYFCPKREATRGEIAKMLDNARQKFEFSNRNLD